MRHFLIVLFVSISTVVICQDSPVDTFEGLSDQAGVKERLELMRKLESYFRGIRYGIDNEKEKDLERFNRLAHERNDSIFLWICYNQKYSQNPEAKEISRKYGFHLDNHNDRQRIFSNLSIYHDKSGNKTIEDIRSNENVFTWNQSLLPNYNYDPENVYWSKLILHGDSQKTDDYLISFDPHYYYASWKKIDAWLVHQDGRIEYFQTGDQFKPHEKPVPSLHNFLSLHIAQNERAQLYFRMEGTVPEKHKKPGNIRIHILNKEVFPGLFLGYPFKGKFYDRYEYYATNEITQHELYLDTSGHATIEDITQNEARLDWKDPSRTLHQPNTVYWMRFVLHGSLHLRGEQVFHIAGLFGSEYFSFDYIDSYVSDNQGGYHHQRTGDHVAYKDRPYNHWASLIKIDIEPRDTITLFLRLEGANSRFLNPKGEPISVYHVDPISLFQNQNKGQWVKIILNGGLLIQFFFFLLLFFTEREISHFYFSLISIGLLMALGFHPDDNYSATWIPKLVDDTIPLFFLGYFLACTGYLKFTETYFDYLKSSIFSRWFIPTFIIISALVCINAAYQFELYGGAKTPGWNGKFTFIISNTYFIEHWYFRLVMFMIVITILLITIMVLFAPRKDKISNRFFLLAFAPAFLFFSLWMISESFYFELYPRYNVAWHDFFRNGFKISVIGNIVLLAINIGNRTNQLKTAKAVAEQKNIFDQIEKENAEKIRKSAIQLTQTNNLLEIQNTKNEILLKEIHHRVKNNLQTISSLLRLQSASINDPSALDAVQDSQNRVASMALIHQKLYLGENLAAIEMRDYFETICREIFSSFGKKAKDIALEIEMQEIEFDVDTAIPVGLITNELLTNSLKYAFQDKLDGKIAIKMQKSDKNQVTLIIEDNGTHITNLDSNSGIGFGNMLIRLLTTQLNGTLEQNTASGTQTILRFFTNEKL